MSRPDPEVPALKAAVAKRMKELGLSPTDLADATGITVQGLLNLRNGRRRKYQARLTGPVCRVLGWTPDSIERILAGGKPKLAPPLEPAPEVTVKLAELERLLDGVSARLDVLADNQAELFDMAHRHGERRSGDAEPAAL